MPPASEDWLSKLNPQQQQAATFGAIPGEEDAPPEPLLIIAGAGTGKTNTLAYRVAHLIRSGVHPARILLLTFTRRAAAEMLKRVESVLTAAGVKGSAAAQTSRVWGGTFHAIANRILRLHCHSMGLTETFTVMDRSDSEDLMDIVRSELALDKGDARFPRKGSCHNIYSRCVNAQESVEDAVNRHFPWCSTALDKLKALFKAYVDRKQQQNVLDYDDLLLYWAHMMRDDDVAADVRDRFDAVLVDEYQDTNALQAEILRQLKPDGRGVTVVGDDAQAIYGFRAATVDNILQFPEQFPGTTVLKLEQNYRSVQPILDATNAIIADSETGYDKMLFSHRKSEQKPRLVTVMDEEAQSDYVINEVLQQLEGGIALKRQAVLFRASHHSDTLEVELARRNIPFVKYGGLKFLEAAHVKDALCFLRLAENPRDLTSAFRVLQLLDGIGPASARAIIAHLGDTQFDLNKFGDAPAPPAGRDQFALLSEILMKLAKNEAPPLPQQVAMVRKFYEPILDRRYDNADVRRRDLEQLEQVSNGFDNRQVMLSELALDPPASTQDLAGPPLLEEDYLILSTVHSAKGCEWDCVYVIHAADGNFPSDMSTGSVEEIEEERRLFYVATTRAKDFLSVVAPLRYYHKKWSRSDRHSYAQITRFIPESRMDLYERVSPTGGPVQRVTGEGSQVEPPKVDVRKSISSMWA